MSPTVLIVDDEPAVRQALQRALRGEPYRLLEADSAKQALALLQDETVDILLCDHHMPGQTGLQLCEALQERNPTLVRILMTGAGDAGLVGEAVERETVYHCLQKPWESGELRLLLRLALRHRADLRELERLRQLTRAQRRIIMELESARS
ncbi:MAG: response regulator [Myxococcales bacterium]|nr:response regulator [Myxococcales bacterium]